MGDDAVVEVGVVEAREEGVGTWGFGVMIVL
jgi:hypothetical protein